MDLVTVRALKFNGRPHFEWMAHVVVDNPDGIVTVALPGTRCIHHSKGLEIELEHFSIGLFRLGARWNAMFDYDDRGKALMVYCNVTMPLVRPGRHLEWVDLDLDVVCAPSGAPDLADESEFERHSKQYAYPDDVIARARLTAEKLLDQAGRRAFPFTFPTFDFLLTDLGAAPTTIAGFR